MSQTMNSNEGHSLVKIKHGVPTPGKRVQVYLNLNKDGLFSIIDDARGSVTRGKVLAYAETVHLKNARAKLLLGKYKWILTHNRRTVCAMFIGELVSVNSVRPVGLERMVSYNPFRCKEFQSEDGSIVSFAEEIHLSEKKGWVR